MSSRAKPGAPLVYYIKRNVCLFERFLEKTIKDRDLKQIAVCRESFRIGFKTK